MTQAVGIARAHTNIALIKYWGKRDKNLFLPMNSSLSLTLEAFYTDTKVTFDDHLTEDIFLLNGKEQSEKEVAKISRFLDLFCEYIGERPFARVESINFVPTAAGLASSASALGWIRLPRSMVSPSWKTMPEVSWPKSGWNTPRKSCTGLLVTPIFLPTMVSPAATRRSIMRNWMA
mgnify:CR=1 FL=1